MSAVEGATLVGGRYRLDERIGRGGMADVYRATDEVLERVVALKWLRQPALDASDVARARSEARLLARLNHPMLVTVHDAGVDEDRPYLVMELVDGPSLAREAPSDPAGVASVGARVAEALAYVHSQGLVHRDVKPGNVLVAHSPEPWGQVKLADFGIARLLDATRLTSTGTVVGTTAFCAPEQLRGDPVGPPADVWSLGLVLIECLSGAPAYPGDPADAIVVRLRRPPAVPTSLPAEWVALLRAMTALDASARPRSRVAADRLLRLATSAAKRGAPTPAPPSHSMQDTASLPPTAPALPPTEPVAPALPPTEPVAPALPPTEPVAPAPSTAAPVPERPPAATAARSGTVQLPVPLRRAFGLAGDRLVELRQRLTRPSLGPSRQRQRAAAFLAALVAVAVIAIVLAVTLPGGGTPSNAAGTHPRASRTTNSSPAATASGTSEPTPLPAPNLPGPVGNDLRALHQAVNP